MKAYLDDKPIDVERPTLAGAVETATQHAARDGRVIVEVKIDGEVVSSDLLASPPETDLGQSEIALASADPRLLVRETLYDAAGALEQTRQGQIDCADQIQAGDMSDAFEALPKLLQEWQMVQEVLVGSARLLGTPVETLLPEDDAVEALSNQLQQVRGAIERQDWSALSDTLAYDLAETAQQWSDMLTTIADGLNTPPPPEREPG